MEVLELVKKSDGRQVVIDLPEALEGKQLHIKISEQRPEGDFRKFRDMPVEERLKALEKFKGTAKYPDMDLSKFDVYDQ